MNLLIDNNDGRGQQDYTAWVDAEHLPKIARKLNRAATMTASLVNCGPGFTPPVSGARVDPTMWERRDTCLPDISPPRPSSSILARDIRGRPGATRLLAVDDSCLLDHNALPVRTPFAWRTAGDALRTLANDVLPGGLDLSGVQDVSPRQPVPHRAAEDVDGARAGADDDGARHLSRARWQAGLPAGRPAELHHQRPGHEVCAGRTDAAPARRVCATM